MRVCRSLICCLFLTLQHRDSLVDAQTNIYTKLEGEDITVRCKLDWSGSRRLLCKETCEGRNILIKTSKDEDHNGRYSIKYEYHLIGSIILHVTITKLRKSDSGLYRCEFHEKWYPDSQDTFKIIVTEASVISTPSTQTSSVPTTTSRTTTTTTTTKSLNSTSSSHQTTNLNTSSGVLLYVGVTLVGLISMFLVALLIFCRSRRFKQKKEPPSETQYANVTLPNQECEEIRENTSPPVQISTVYANVKYKKVQRSDNTDGCPQSKDEDHSIQYSIIQFPNSAPPSSALCGHKDNDIYSSA